jgi:hypothetical protein
MERINITSSTIKSVGYDVNMKVLEIEFTRGVIYQYNEIPFEIYNNFMTSKSKGNFLSINIMKKYPFKKVYDPKGE